MSDTVPPSPSSGKPTRPEDDISDEDACVEDAPLEEALVPPPLSLTHDLEEAEDFVTPMLPNFPPKDIKLEVNGNGSGNGNSPKGWASGTAFGDWGEGPMTPISASFGKRHVRRSSRQYPNMVIDTTKTKLHHSPAQNAAEKEPGANPTLPLSALPRPPGLEYNPGGKKSLEGIAVRAFCLGNALSLCLSLVIAILTLTSSALWRVPFFVGALALFHFLEFWTTARRNTKEAGVKAFLLTANWPHYAIAHSSAMLECLVTNVLWPHRTWAPLYTSPILLLLGLLLTFMGQFIRTAAMLQAGSNFNHIVQTRLDGHELVTTGIYSVIRHPAYFAFFWWGLGTQLVLGNPICFVGYAAVLWRFFSIRIREEELWLVNKYKEDYPEYKKRTPTRIPFIA
ncbi:protein-S-isoprenylcysteine O-methyltransferase [Apiospora rasikravindrae]|uniref:Protein-S-isoprenylcysteine O-methyltransferase n=1 Tax=Apiospora rasikravindrae TaxID=990691 RepID=A0ABR1T6A8_9PEZI